MRIVGEISELVTAVESQGAEFAALKHPWRTSVSEEIEACLSERKIDTEQAHMARVRLKECVVHGLPEDAPLLENKVIVRRHTSEKVQAAMEDWWYELTHFVARDQLSLPFVLWKHSVPYQVIPLSVWQDRTVFQRYSHRKPGLAGALQFVTLRRNEGCYKYLYWLYRFPFRIVRKFNSYLPAVLSGDSSRGQKG